VTYSICRLFVCAIHVYSSTYFSSKLKCFLVHFHPKHAACMPYYLWRIYFQIENTCREWLFTKLTHACYHLYPTTTFSIPLQHFSISRPHTIFFICFPPVTFLLGIVFYPHTTFLMIFTPRFFIQTTFLYPT